jgi:hypothetical protein
LLVFIFSLCSADFNYHHDRGVVVDDGLPVGTKDTTELLAATFRTARCAALHPSIFCSALCPTNCHFATP